jgi:hydrogenase expression/formation protein HypE
MDEYIKMAHGSGGKLSNKLIEEIFYKEFSNEILDKSDDSAKLHLDSGDIAFSTDSFVITPIFFKGGDIGKLSICGTVNDIAAVGAKPIALTCGFILEEGFSVSDLKKIAKSMAKVALEAGVKIVAGDTKVVQKGACDKIFINTSGIGIILKGNDIGADKAIAGDSVIVTGTMGDHGASILLQRESLSIESDLESDCAPLNLMVESIVNQIDDIHVLRDPTRGGLATILNEISVKSNVGIELFEDKIPVKPQVQGICDLLGMDPLYMANEGKLVIILPSIHEDKVLDILKQNKYGRDSCVIGHVVDNPKKMLWMKTNIGGKRVIDLIVGDQLPRIC